MAEISKMKNIEQERARFAYDCAVEGISIKEKKKIGGILYEDEHYASYVRNIPMYIKTNGLGSTITFVYSKRAEEEKEKEKEKNELNAYDLIYKQIKDWFIIGGGKGLLSIKKEDDLAQKIILLNSYEYRVITIELLSLFKWIKRFAEGLDKKKGNKNGSVK